MGSLFKFILVHIVVAWMRNWSQKAGGRLQVETVAEKKTEGQEAGPPLASSPSLPKEPNLSSSRNPDTAAQQPLRK
jgi:hypothetical protein